MNQSATSPLAALMPKSSPATGNLPVAAACLAVALVVLALLGTAIWWQCLLWGAATAAATAAAWRLWGWQSARAPRLLMVAVTLVWCMGVANIWWYTDAHGCSPQMPWLANWDHCTDFYLGRAIAIDGFDVIERGTRPMRNYGVTHGCLMHLLGVSIVVPVMLNVLLYAVLLVATGHLTRLCTSSDKCATAAMVMAMLVLYLAVQGSTPIKDVPLALCTTLWAVLMVDWSRKDSSPSPAGYVAMAAVLMAMSWLRVGTMLMVIAATLLLWVPRRPWAMARSFVFAVMMAVAIMGLMKSSPQGRIQHRVEEFITAPDSPRMQVDDNNIPVLTQPTSDPAPEDYVHRVLWLPCFVGLNFITPLPWTATQYLTFSPVMWLAHIGFFWYLWGALILFWLARRLRRADGAVQRLVLTGVLFTIGTAWYSSGHASRYCLSFLPLLLPAAADVWVHCRRWRSLHRWLWCFGGMLAAALIVALCLHSQYPAAA